MSTQNFYYGGAQHPSHSNLHSTHPHPHHAGRSRRSTRTTGYHHRNEQKQLRAQQLKKEAAIESAMEQNFRKEFEAARSFDLDDDEQFCPFHLLTEDDLQSIHSSGSDRSSLSSGSPETSPLQHQAQPSSHFLLPPTTGNFSSNLYQQSSSPQSMLHQPSAQRSRNAIPIVDPSTRAVASPPPSVSPARQMHQARYAGKHRWQ
ncbi:hypothetical protein E2P81_ATG04617 [Venturia nashicola]|uniref:Uncharacterized protein n=1 Tax=Venturia nashicola TaxID=86259 RepID=A0A4Z1P0R5_9PEZI|nr:hypothetical protein E6O75_ATG04725 [Venturia nashicola]TLD34452.1 hypothetical protein E2P81_ATG04617 [Venturia nashicola]